MYLFYIKKYFTKKKSLNIIRKSKQFSILSNKILKEI